MKVPSNVLGRIKAKDRGAFFATGKRILFAAWRHFGVRSKFQVHNLTAVAPEDPDLADAISEVKETGVDRIGKRVTALLRSYADDGVLVGGHVLKYEFIDVKNRTQFWFEKAPAEVHVGRAAQNGVEVQETIPVEEDDPHRVTQEGILELARCIGEASRKQTTEMIEAMNKNTDRLIETFERLWGVKK